MFAGITMIFCIFEKKRKMQVYRFETHISKNGIIQLPSDQQFSDRDVEVIILSRPDFKPNKNASADFVNKWTGFLSNANVEESKFQYLSEKYK